LFQPPHHCLPSPLVLAMNSGPSHTTPGLGGGDGGGDMGTATVEGTRNGVNADEAALLSPAPLPLPPLPRRLRLGVPAPLPTPAAEGSRPNEPWSPRPLTPTAPGAGRGTPTPSPAPAPAPTTDNTGVPDSQYVGTDTAGVPNACGGTCGVPWPRLSAWPVGARRGEPPTATPRACAPAPRRGLAPAPRPGLAPAPRPGLAPAPAPAPISLPLPAPVTLAAEGREARLGSGGVNGSREPSPVSSLM
jgi:hypothetical protein